MTCSRAEHGFAEACILLLPYSALRLTVRGAAPPVDSHQIDGTATAAVSKPEMQPFGEKTVTENELAVTKTRANPPGKQIEPRAPRSIRFSNEEWTEIERAADTRGMTAAELVRHAAAILATRKHDPSSLPIPFETVAQLERIYRGVYPLSTLKRDGAPGL